MNQILRPIAIQIFQGVVLSVCSNGKNINFSQAAIGPIESR